MRYIVLLFFGLINFQTTYAQGCCSGGSGSPIAGGASQGVLLDRQAEIALNYQCINTNHFQARDKDTAKLTDGMNSNYLYLRTAYGVSKNFTMSVECGYFLNKTEVGLNRSDTFTSSGIGDLLLFPRYDVLNRTSETRRSEITIGLGYKIPLGKYNDSTNIYTNPNTGQKYYTISPPIVQPTNGSNDIVFYSFFFRGYPLKNFRLFANTLYVRKGWNPLGQKFGDYASIGLFAGQTFFKKLGVTLQLKGEWIGKMHYNEYIDMVALYNVDPLATGGHKVFVVPQVSYSFKNFNIYSLTEIPVYQYVNSVQIASRFSTTIGISYRFLTYKTGRPEYNENSAYYCPMHPEVVSPSPGKCPKCGMDLVKNKK